MDILTHKVNNKEKQVTPGALRVTNSKLSFLLVASFDLEAATKTNNWLTTEVTKTREALEFPRNRRRRSLHVLMRSRWPLMIPLALLLHKNIFCTLRGYLETQNRVQGVMSDIRRVF